LNMRGWCLGSSKGELDLPLSFGQGTEYLFSIPHFSDNHLLDRFAFSN
jgi:hypothetical protein